MTAARLVLERSTMMLLTSSKVTYISFQRESSDWFMYLRQTSLRHPECTYSKENRDTVFCQMRRAMDLIHYVVKDGVLETSNERNVSRQVRTYFALNVDKSTISLAYETSVPASRTFDKTWTQAFSQTRSFQEDFSLISQNKCREGSICLTTTLITSARSRLWFPFGINF